MNYNDYNRNPDEQEPIMASAFRVEDQVPPPRKKNHMGVKITAACLSCALIGGLAGGGGMLAVSGMLNAKNSTTVYEGAHTPTVVSVANVSSETPLTAPQIYATYVGSTVGITTELVTTNLWGQSVPGAAAGSGFVYSTDGYIITNYHVINGATAIKVNFMDGKSYTAKLVGGEEDNDIAVLKIEATGLKPVILGDSNGLQVGEPVVAIGNPLGELTYSLTQGVVSAKDRAITTENGVSMNMIQTDTAINSGNSGGPLFNMYGQVIGITSAKLSNGSSSGSASIEGLGFAIPMNDIKDMILSIIQNGYVTGKPNVGILMDEVSAQAVQQYGVPAGVLVAAVLPDSCADKAGITANDIITTVNGTAITSREGLKAAVKDFKAGDSTEFVVSRSGETISMTITFDEDSAARETAMNELYQQHAQQQMQQQQQQQQQSGSGYSNWPFGNTNPFGN